MAKTPPAAVPSESAPSESAAADAAGAASKGRPTPTRAEQEAARKRPLVADTKEAKQRAKADLAAKRDKARVGMAAGDERYLPVRDKGPQRRFVREWVDSRWSLGEWIMPVMVLVIVATFLPSYFFQYYAFVVLWIFVFFVIGEMIITSIRVKRAVAAKFGADKVEKGLGWYAAMRQVQMRLLRLPKPQVKRGGKPVA